MGDENSLLKPTNKLDLKTKLGYGAGGVLNVMAVTMINSYLLIYYHGVLHLSNQNAGIIMLVGKISGGVFTILIGIVSDLSMKNCWLYSRFGKRKVRINIFFNLSKHEIIHSMKFAPKRFYLM